MDIEIIFENKKFLVLNKPAGLVVHPDGRTEELSVTGWLLEHYPKLKEVGGDLELPAGGSIPRVGLVHRIDRETSGILLVAKDQKTFEYLQEQFQTRTVQKIYHAFVYGDITDDEGVINLPIGRSKADFRRWSAERGARGTLREAVTNYKVLGRTGKFTFLEVEPKTGRTHQIRVHFKALQHPIVSDSLYAPNQPQALNFERLALHARAISFNSAEGKVEHFEAPYPEDFKKALDFVKKFAK
jgi:23S rRNA pseudouridine1911/1915/1917 synthase